MKAASILAIFLFLILAAQAQTNQSAPVPTLSYDELMRNKEAYFGKTVRLKAFWNYGFEWSSLCGEADCRKAGVKTWLELLDEDDLCKGSKAQLKKGSTKHINNSAQVVFVGKFSSGTFGHMGAYNYQFTVSCVEGFKKLKV
ncbi:MAG TPA: hypothetical protein VF721_23645 [Pyrinomonadaceae bacterium]|jgi:hypothetical protein